MEYGVMLNCNIQLYFLVTLFQVLCQVFSPLFIDNHKQYIDGLVQERYNSIANALELLFLH